MPSFVDPSHPRPIMTIPTTTRRPTTTTLATVFPWVNTTASLAIGSVPAVDLATLSPVASTSTSDSLSTSSVVPSVPQENLVIPSESDNQDGQNVEKLSTEAPVSASSPIISNEILPISTESTSSPPVQTEAPVLVAIAQNNFELGTSNDNKDNEAEKQEEPLASTEASPPSNINAQGDIPIDEAPIAPQSTVPEESLTSSTVINTIIEPATASDVQAVRPTDIVSSVPTEQDGNHNVSVTEAALVTNEVEEVTTIESTQILGNVDVESNASSSVLADAVQPSEVINPSVATVSVLASSVEPATLPALTFDTAPAVGQTEEIHEGEPVESHTEIAPSAGISSSAETIVKEVGGSASQSLDPEITITTAQPAYQDFSSLLESQEPSHTIPETQSNDISVSDPVTDNSSQASPSDESKPLVQHDIIIDPAESHNEVPAILSQQKEVESAQKVPAHTVTESEQKDADTSSSVHPTDSSVQNLDEQVFPTSALPISQDKQLAPRPEEDQNDGEDLAPLETTSSSLLSHIAPESVNNKIETVVADDIVATTSLPSSFLATDEQLISQDPVSQDENAPATEKTEEKQPSGNELASDQSSLSLDESGTSSLPEKSTETYQNDGINSPADGEIQTTPAVQQTQNDEPATTLAAVANEEPTVEEHAVNHLNQENGNVVAQDGVQTTEIPVTIMTDDEAQTGHEPAAGHIDSNNYIEHPLKILHDDVAAVPTTTSPPSLSSVVSHDEEVSNQFDEIATTAKSYPALQDGPQNFEINVASSVQHTVQNDQVPTTRQPELSAGSLDDEGQGVTDSQQKHDSSSEVHKLRLDPSVFSSVSGETSEEQAMDENKNTEKITETTPAVIIQNDAEDNSHELSTQAPLLSISRQELVTTDLPSTESDIVFDSVGSTIPPSSVPQSYQFKSEPISSAEESITTTEPSILQKDQEARNDLDTVDSNSVPVEQNIESTTEGIIDGRERSDLGSMEISNAEDSTLSQQVRTKISSGESNNEIDSDPTTTQVPLDDEKIEENDPASTTPAEELLRHHHPDHEGFLIEETTRLPQQQEQGQLQDEAETQKSVDSSSLFRTLDATTTVVNEPAADEQVETTISSEPGFRSDLDIDIITSSSSPQSLTISKDDESNSPLHAVSLSDEIQPSSPSVAPETVKEVDEPAQTTISYALADDVDEATTTAAAAAIVGESATVPERLRQDAVVFTTASSPVQFQDEAEEDETTLSSFNDDTPTTTIFTALDETENETDISPTASAIVDNRVSPDIARRPNPIADDLADNGLGRSDLSLQVQLKEEVNSADDSWFWRTVNRVRRLSDFFTVLSRKARSTKTSEMEKPVKTKKPTQMDPKKKPLIRPYLFW